MAVRPHSEEGFTLLEVILALVLTGLLAAMAGTGVVSGFNVFMAARDNVHITQKANLALTRITRELHEITDVVDVDADVPYIIYDTADVRNAIALVANSVKLFSDIGATGHMDAGYLTANGDVLIDGVASFSLNYFNGSNAWQTSPALAPIRQLSAISFQFAIKRNSLGGRTSTFGNTAHLRNNNNYGGAVLVVTPPTPPTENLYCFINTARSGFMSHLWILFPLLLVSIALASLRQGFKGTPRLRLRRDLDNKGVALLAIIVVLVVFSALAIVMVPMITTSQYTQLGQDTASKTYYLAESGYRYAASQYLNAPSETAKNSALENLHNQSFALAGGVGSFQLEVFPYYGYVLVDPSGTSTLTVRVPGGLTADLDASAFSTPGRVQIGTTVFSYSNASVSPPDISFNMAAAMPSIPASTDVFQVARTSGSAQTVNQDESITMAAGSTRTFPLQNAEVIINDNVYAYRTNDRTSNLLVGISDPEVANMTTLDIPAGTDVVLSKFVNLQSTGSYGSGTLVRQRLLTYHVPLPNTAYSRRRIEFHDTFDDPDHWNTIWGGQSVLAIGGNNALVLDNPQYVMNLPRVSLTALDWTTTEIDLEEIHQKAGYYLSYDAQVKIGFQGPPPIPAEPSAKPFTPAGSSIPTFFAGGLNFRLDSTAESHNTYGLSFLRGLNDAPYDRLDDDIVAAEEVPIIVLWQQTGGSNRTWLAWEQIGDLELEGDDAEGGGVGWTSSGLWHITTFRHANGSSSWYYGQESVYDYDTGASNSGELISPEIDLDICDYDYIFLSFWSRHATEATTAPDEFDLKSIDVQTYESGSWSGWSELDRIEGAYSEWTLHEIDLSAYIGKRIQLRFYFNTNGTLNNGPRSSGYEGWYLDDIRIAGYWPLQEATLALRLQEAPSLRFTNGGTYVVKPGDAVYQATASAIVDANPVITGGSWAGGNAAGHLVLRDVSGTFALDQPFSVIGGGQVGIAREVRTRDNFIRAYYGSAAGCGTSNTNPLDNEKLANPRNPTELAWPPVDGDPYTAEDDSFTLIQWDLDKINSSVSSFSRLTATQLRSNELVTPSSLLGRTRPEIGLHAMGRGSENIYFDDFGLSVVSNDNPADVTAPIQE